MSANSNSKLFKIYKQQSTDSDSSKVSSSSCSCNNISIMQLFHEMKQKFPTVPDNIVIECATENWHDRDKCIAALENELRLHPNTTYPSQVIRNGSHQNNPQLKPIRPAPAPAPTSLLQSSSNSSCASSTFSVSGSNPSCDIIGEFELSLCRLISRRT